MELGAKVRHLRQVEGVVRGMGRPMTKAEVVRAMRAELGQAISQAYLSQIESGARGHMTESTRDLLARFFKVHPGYLVSDPAGYDSSLSLDLQRAGADSSDTLQRWLLQQAEAMAGEPTVAHLLWRLARLSDPRPYLWLFDQVVDLGADEAARRLSLPIDSPARPAAARAPMEGG